LRGRADDASAWTRNEPQRTNGPPMPEHVPVRPVPLPNEPQRTNGPPMPEHVPVRPVPLPPRPRPPPQVTTTTTTRNPTLDYSCKTGQGAWGQSYAHTSHNDMRQCAKKCDDDPECAAFDLTTMASMNACRLYDDSASSPRLGSGGWHFRQICSKKATCFKHGYKWIPLDMPGSERSNERDALACQARCARTKGCSHFSYWHFYGVDGGCHLQDDTAFETKDRPGTAISGPSSCGKPAQTDLPAKTTTGPCFEKGYKMLPLDMVSTERSWELTAEDCQARCARMPGCFYFTFWIDGGCHLQDRRAKRTWDPSSFGTGTIGPRVC